MLDDRLLATNSRHSATTRENNMKKLLVLALLGVVGYHFYQNGFSIFGSKGAFDSNDKPIVVFFSGPGCDAICDRVRSFLQARNVAFEEIDIAGSDGAPTSNKYGVRGFPTTLVGSHEVRGDDLPRLTSVLAETYGRQVLSRKEQRLMAQHFDANGRAEVVMYATQWCPYCKKQREYFADNDIPYREVDAEATEENKARYAAFEAGGYPLTYVGYRRFEGYHERDLATAIKEVAKAGPMH
jgi:glutaredoxin